jgi:AcrR family transcriptional regulator
MSDPLPQRSETASSSQGPVRRGRPRSEKARTAILAAAEDLLLNGGLEAVSMDAIAERASVSKATIYRWWPTKETLAVDALYADWAESYTATPDTGSLREDLLALLLPWVDLVTSRPYARIIGALLTKARSDDKFAEEYDRRLVQPRRALARPIFTHAIERGEILSQIDPEVALDLLYGPLYFRLLQAHLPLDKTFVEAIVERTLGGLLTR